MPLSCGCGRFSANVGEQAGQIRQHGDVWRCSLRRREMAEYCGTAGGSSDWYLNLDGVCALPAMSTERAAASAWRAARMGSRCRRRARRCRRSDPSSRHRASGRVACRCPAMCWTRVTTLMLRGMGSNRPRFFVTPPVTTVRDRLVKIGAKIVRHGCSITFQVAEVWCPARCSSRYSTLSRRCVRRHRHDVEER